MISQSYQSAEKEAAGAKTTEEGDVIRAKKTQDMLPHFLEALWNTSALDIESTLRVVCDKVLHDHAVDAAARKKRGVALGVLGAFYTLVPVRPRWRGERRSLRTFAVVSLRPGSHAFNPRPRRLSTPTDPFESHPDIRSYGTTLRHGIREASVDRITPLCVNAAVAGVKVGDEVERGETRVSVVFVRKERR